jgi:alpha-amylase/alpha-mannosidase (GH57 family)
MRHYRFRFWNREITIALIILVFGFIKITHAMVKSEDGEVKFSHTNAGAKSVYLVGEFNDWDNSSIPMKRDANGNWQIKVALSVGFYEYKFIVDGKWTHDTANPPTVTNNYGQPNSVFYLNSVGTVELRAPSIEDTQARKSSIAGDGFIYLSIIWLQHQPYYLDASKDQLVGPWVRTHTTKDYYDMTAMIAEFPDIHATVSLTPVLLRQLEIYYVDRLKNFYLENENRIDAPAFMEKWQGKTDPWVDLMFKETSDFDADDEEYLFRAEWSCFSISRVIMNRFPEYAALRNKNTEKFTTEDKRDLKCWFWLANFDPDFLTGAVELVDGSVVDLSDMVNTKDGPTWVRGRHFSEDHANRLVAEFYKIAHAVIPLHRKLKYNAKKHSGQVELITTPLFHPILPLLIDANAGMSPSDRASDDLDFKWEKDARLQIWYALNDHSARFSGQLLGMLPSEGSVSQEVVDLIAVPGFDVQWIATGDGVLAKSKPVGMIADTPYQVTGKSGKSIAVFFRDTHLSELVDFRYQRMQPEDAADDLIRQIRSKAPTSKEDTVQITILLVGENAWEWYEHDADVKQFLRSFYQKLSALQVDGRLMTVTPAEYLTGNPHRGITAHPIEDLPLIDSLWSGSWIRADFSTWIGEAEENRAWQWLARTRAVLEEYLISNPKVTITEPHSNVLSKVFSEMFAAEGSDWTWWYGKDQNSGDGDIRFDMLFRNHLTQVYRELKAAGCDVEIPDIPSLLDDSDGIKRGTGAMAPGE